MPTLLTEIRKLHREGGSDHHHHHHDDHEEPPHILDPVTLRRIVTADQALSSSQRTETLNWLDDPAALQELRSGSIGAALSLLASKYLNLSSRNQLLLSIAGFGLGKIIYDYKQGQRKSSKWNKNLKMYELEQ